MQYGRLAVLEAKNFFGEWTTLLALLSILLAGGYGLYYGKTLLATQQRVIDEVPRTQQQHTAESVHLHQAAGLGNVLYYHNFHTVHAPSPWAAFALGQRDVYPYNLKIRMLAVEGQLYDTDLANPVTLLFGNFDLAFVFVFLFPLLIITLTYNMVAAEQEAGVWTMVRAQPVAVGRVLLLKGGVRLATVLAAALLLGLAGVAYLGLPADTQLGAAAVLLLLYLLFWFSLSALVVAVNQSSSFNAVALLGLWILLTVLAPAALNVALTNALPIPEALENTIQQRESYHEKWDRPKDETLQRFYRRYPALRAYPLPLDKFSWGWYYAMQEMGDEESTLTSQRLLRKLRRRQAWADQAALFLPTINVQLGLNKIAGTDLSAHLGYLRSVRGYHAQVRRYFYPFIFQEAPTSAVPWSQAPKHPYYHAPAVPLVSAPVAALLVLTLALGVGAGFTARRRLR